MHIKEDARPSIEKGPTSHILAQGINQVWPVQRVLGMELEQGQRDLG